MLHPALMIHHPLSGIRIIVPTSYRPPLSTVIQDKAYKTKMDNLHRSLLSIFVASLRLELRTS